MSDEQELPKSWALTKVGDICLALQYGYTASATNEPCGPRLLRITDIQDGQVQWPSVPYCSIDPSQVAKYALQKGDIVFARTGGTVGKSFIINTVPEQSVFASYLIRLTPHPSVNAQFLYYFFQSLSYWEQIGLKKGGLQGNVNATSLATLDLPIGPTSEQARIVAKIEELFSELDNGVESLTTAREQLRVYREAVLQEHLLGGQKKVAPVSETPLPSKWRWVSLSEMATLITKGASPKWQGINYVNDETQTLFVTSENVRSNFIDISKPKFIENSFNDAQKRSILHAGDVLFNIVGASIGRAAMFCGEGLANINQAVSIIRIEDKNVAEYVALFLNSGLGQSTYMDKRVEVARANLSLKDVRNIKVPLPPKEKLRDVLNSINSTLSQVETLERNLDEQEHRSRALRTCILTKAFSGQLVAQYSNDEPALVLLERIRGEREQSTTRRPRNGKNKEEAA